MNIVFLDTSTVGTVNNLSKIETFGKFTGYAYTSKEQTIERTKDAEIIITNKVIIDKQVIDKSPVLKLVCIAATGMNNVDLEYARQKGILVKNVSGYSTFSVTQSTFSMLFYLLSQSRYYDEYVKSGSYTKSKIFTHHGREFWEIKDKVWGIIGLGNIGKSVGRIAKAFGCKVIFYSTSGNNTFEEFEREDLDNLLGKSDIVSIHAPLNKNTENLLNAEKLGKMKPGAILINAGRGGIVNEADLAEALDGDNLAGAALDVLQQEPMHKENPLLKITRKEKLFITPHIAWASMESRTLLIEKICENIETFIRSGY